LAVCHDYDVKLLQYRDVNNVIKAPAFWVLKRYATSFLDGKLQFFRLALMEMPLRLCASHTTAQFTEIFLFVVNGIAT
jgi:hypothetical protein